MVSNVGGSVPIKWCYDSGKKAMFSTIGEHIVRVYLLRLVGSSAITPFHPNISSSFSHARIILFGIC